MNHTTYLHIMDGFHDHNIRFSDVCTLLKHLAFQLRIKGDHFIFSRADIPEIINLQPLGQKTINAILFPFRIFLGVCQTGQHRMKRLIT